MAWLSLRGIGGPGARGLRALGATSALELAQPASTRPPAAVRKARRSIGSLKTVPLRVVVPPPARGCAQLLTRRRATTPEPDRARAAETDAAHGRRRSPRTRTSADRRP